MIVFFFFSLSLFSHYIIIRKPDTVINLEREVKVYLVKCYIFQVSQIAINQVMVGWNTWIRPITIHWQDMYRAPILVPVVFACEEHLLFPSWNIQQTSKFYNIKQNLVMNTFFFLNWTLNLHWWLDMFICVSGLDPPNNHPAEKDCITFFNTSSSTLWFILSFRSKRKLPSLSATLSHGNLFNVFVKD